MCTVAILAVVASLIREKTKSVLKCIPSSNLTFICGQSTLHLPCKEVLTCVDGNEV